MLERSYANQLTPSIDAFKSHVRVTNSDLDAELTSCLKAAINAAEHYIGKIISQSTFTYTGVFSASIKLMKPLVSVTSVKVDGVATTSYSVSDGYLLIDGVGSSVEVVYTAGWSNAPEDLQKAVMLHAAALFNNPVDSVETLPRASRGLLNSYRTWGRDGE